jgi:hypothetical protein
MRDDTDQFAQLRTVLTFRDKVKSRLNNVRADVLKNVLADEPGPETRRVAAGDLHPQESLIVLAAFECARPRIEPALLEEVMAKLDRPPIVAVEDLLSAFMEHLVVREDEYDGAYGRFVRGIVARIRMVASRPIPIATSSQKLPEAVQNKILWQNSIASVALVGSGPAGAERELGTSDPADRSIVLYARANVFGTARAASSLEEEVGPLLRSLLFSFAQLTLATDQPPMKAGLPCVSEKDFIQHLARVHECLEVFFGKVGKADSIDGRLRNAALLLTEADRQKHFAIAVSLCFSAMEAMLSPGSGDITANLSRNIATMLEPPDANRTGAMKVVKDLYNVRSKVLHGASLDFDPKTITSCRFLAAAVLLAFVERRAYALRAGNGKPEEPGTLFDVIQSAQMNGKKVEGVTESAARRCWEAQA